MKIRLLVSAMAVSMLLAACGGTSSNSSGAAKSSITDETSSIASSEEDTSASSEENTPASSEEGTLPSTFTTNLQFLSKFTYGFANKLYQGASDSFAISLPEALSSGSYTVAEDADGSEVASFTGSWMKLSLLNNGTYSLNDLAGYNMSETGTWALDGFVLGLVSSASETYKASVILKHVFKVAFVNSLYQGASDTFEAALPEALSSGSYTVAEDADGSEVASFTGSWMKLSLLNNGTYSLNDLAGYKMSETGTWTLSGCKLTVLSDVADAKAVEAVLADAITVAFANPLYQGAGDSFKVSLTDEMLGGSYKVAEDADGSELVAWNGSWMKLSLANDGSYVLSDNAGYNMSEAGTWTLSGGVLSFVSGYAA